MQKWRWSFGGVHCTVHIVEMWWFTGGGVEVWSWMRGGSDVYSIWKWKCRGRGQDLVVELNIDVKGVENEMEEEKGGQQVWVEVEKSIEKGCYCTVYII